MKTVRLLWDFRGPDSKKTAEHHEIHLREFLQQNDMANEVGTHSFSDMWSVAFLMTDEENFKFFRDRLKPHRGETLEP